MIAGIYISLSSNASDDLPPIHHITSLFASTEHTRFHHAGPQFLTATLRERHWIPRTRNLMKALIISA